MGNMAKRKPDQVIRHEFALSRSERDQLDTVVIGSTIRNVLQGLASILNTPLGAGLSVLAALRLGLPSLFVDALGEEIPLSDFGTESDLADYLENRNLLAIGTIGAGLFLAGAPAWAIAIGALVGGTKVAETAEDFDEMVFAKVEAKRRARRQANLLYVARSMERAQYARPGPVAPSSDITGPEYYYMQS
jgi:hypothetical protein